MRLLDTSKGGSEIPTRLLILGDIAPNVERRIRLAIAGELLNPDVATQPL